MVSGPARVVAGGRHLGAGPSAAWTGVAPPKKVGASKNRRRRIRTLRLLQSLESFGMKEAIREVRRPFHDEKAVILGSTAAINSPEAIPKKGPGIVGPEQPTGCALLWPPVTVTTPFTN